MSEINTGDKVVVINTPTDEDSLRYWNQDRLEFGKEYTVTAYDGVSLKVEEVPCGYWHDKEYFALSELVDNLSALYTKDSRGYQVGDNYYKVGRRKHKGKKRVVVQRPGCNAQAICDVDNLPNVIAALLEIMKDEERQNDTIPF